MSAHRLTWRDAILAWIVGWAGALLLAIVTLPAFRNGAFRTLPSDLAHLWLLAVALFWYFVLRRRYPIGRVRWSELKPWSIAWAIAAFLVLAASPAFFGGTHGQQWTLVAQVLFAQLVVVGPTEEFLSRGVVQTGFNNSMQLSWRFKGRTVKGGTVLASALFGLAHSTNLIAHPINEVAPQVVAAALIGLTIGLLYDRYPNLWGASILHNLINGLQAIIGFL